MTKKPKYVENMTFKFLKSTSKSNVKFIFRSKLLYFYKSKISHKFYKNIGFYRFLGTNFPKSPKYVVKYVFMSIFVKYVFLCQICLYNFWTSHPYSVKTCFLHVSDYNEFRKKICQNIKFSTLFISRAENYMC